MDHLNGGWVNPSKIPLPTTLLKLHFTLLHLHYYITYNITKTINNRVHITLSTQHLFSKNHPVHPSLQSHDYCPIPAL